MVSCFICKKKNEKSFTPMANFLKGSLDSLPSPSLSDSVQIQIMDRKVCHRCKGKTLLGYFKLLFSKVCWQRPAMFCFISWCQLRIATWICHSLCNLFKYIFLFSLILDELINTHVDPVLIRRTLSYSITIPANYKILGNWWMKIVVWNILMITIIFLF